MTDALLLLDSTGRIAWSSGDHADAIGSEPWKLADPDQREAVTNNVLRSLVLHETHRATVTLPSPSGSQRYVVEFRGLPAGQFNVVGILHEIPQGVELLSPREREVLRLFAEGRTTKQIARVLRIAHSTCETHMARAKTKLRIRTHDGLLAYAVRFREMI